MSYYIIIIIIIIVLVVLSQGEVKDLDKKKTQILGFAPLVLWLKANHLTFLNFWFFFCKMVTVPTLPTVARSWDR